MRATNAVMWFWTALGTMIGWLYITPPAMGQVPVLRDIPQIVQDSGPESDVARALVTRRNELVKERKTLIERKATIEGKQVPKGSKAEAQLRQEAEQLEKDIDRHVAESRDFNAEVAAAEQAARDALALRDAPSGASPSAAIAVLISALEPLRDEEAAIAKEVARLENWDRFLKGADRKRREWEADYVSRAKALQAKMDEWKAAWDVHQRSDVLVQNKAQLLAYNAEAKRLDDLRDANRAEDARLNELLQRLRGTVDKISRETLEHTAARKQLDGRITDLNVRMQACREQIRALSQSGQVTDLAVRTQLGLAAAESTSIGEALDLLKKARDDAP